MITLGDFEQDQLREIVSIGAGNAATALSHLINSSVKLSVPEVFLQPFEKIPESIGNRNDVVTTVLLQVTGDVPAVVLLVFPEAAVISLLKLLAGIGEPLTPENELGKSALAEMGNILSGSALTALANFLKLKMVASVPEVATDTLDAILISVLSELGSQDEKLLVFQSTLFLEKELISGRLLFIFNSEASQKVLTVTGGKVTHG